MMATIFAMGKAAQAEACLKGTVCESASVREVIDKNYVCWFCPVDTSTEWNPYASGLGSFTLPLMCVIDPGNLTTYMDRTTGIQYKTVFCERLWSHCPTNRPNISRAEVVVDTVHLIFPTCTNCSYRVLSANNLAGHWAAAGLLVVGSGSVMTNKITTSSSNGFLRLMGFR